jgi:HK97 family phage portal protein
MFDFLKKKDAPEQKIQSPEDSDFSELNKIDHRVDEVRDELKKQFDYTQFELTRDDQGNYFGIEFDIQTTSQRLKALYVREPWCYVCADKIARTASSVPLIVVDSKTEEKNENHPANIIVNAGTAFQDEVSKRWVSMLDLCLAGNSYGVMDDIYSYLIVMPTEMVTLEAKSSGSFEDIVKYGPIDYANIYGYGVNKTAVKVPYQQLIHFKLPNPYNPFYGLSPFAAASRPVLLDRYKNEFEMAFYHRGATHSGVVENEMEISKEKMRRLITSFEQTYTGKRNWWRPLFLPKGAKWKQSSLTMNEMQHLEGLRENRLTLLAVLGIPPSQVGIVQDVNRSTSEIQDKIFWQNTIIPFLNFYCSGYNNSFLFKHKYKSEVKVVPDLTGVQAVEGSISQKGETVNLLKEVLTINELRTDILGYDPLPESDSRGNKFVKEISPNLFGSSPIELPKPTEKPIEETTETEVNPEEKILTVAKEFASSAIVNIEKTLASKFYAYLYEYETMVLNQALDALKQERNVNTYLLVNQSKRLDDFILSGIPILLDAQEKGYSMSLLSTKSVSAIRTKASIGYEFSEEDLQALEAIKQRTNDRQRKLLIERSITRFYGWDTNYSEWIMKTIEKGIEDGKTTAEIAKEIKTSMDKRGGETYRDQAFTIARTETLTAVSEGYKWSNDALNSVFTEVNKIWVHVGDSLTNDDARLDHVEFQELGQKPSDYVYVSSETGGELKYPRDTTGEAEDVINCRCAITPLIPTTSISRAKSIL